MASANFVAASSSHGVDTQRGEVGEHQRTRGLQVGILDKLSTTEANGGLPLVLMLHDLEITPSARYDRLPAFINSQRSGIVFEPTRNEASRHRLSQTFASPCIWRRS